MNIRFIESILVAYKDTPQDLGIDHILAMYKDMLDRLDRLGQKRQANRDDYPAIQEKISHSRFQLDSLRADLRSGIEVNSLHEQLGEVARSIKF